MGLIPEKYLTFCGNILWEPFKNLWRLVGNSQFLPLFFMVMLLHAGVDSRAARKVSDDVQARWLAFADRGVPGADWPQYNSDDRAVMVLDRRRRVELDPHAERRQAWEGFSLSSL